MAFFDDFVNKAKASLSSGFAELVNPSVDGYTDYQEDNLGEYNDMYAGVSNFETTTSNYAEPVAQTEVEEAPDLAQDQDPMSSFYQQTEVYQEPSSLDYGDPSGSLPLYNNVEPFQAYPSRDWTTYIMASDIPDVREIKMAVRRDIIELLRRNSEVMIDLTEASDLDFAEWTDFISYMKYALDTEVDNLNDGLIFLHNPETVVSNIYCDENMDLHYYMPKYNESYSADQIHSQMDAGDARVVAEQEEAEQGKDNVVKGNIFHRSAM